MRRDARLKAFTLIFEKLFSKCDEFDSEMIDELKKVEDRVFAREIIDKFEENKNTLQLLIEKNLKDYEIDRVYKVDLAIIYTALSEIVYLKTPTKVAINEALEIAKVYSTEKSSKFIHGVLSVIIKSEGLC